MVSLQISDIDEMFGEIEQLRKNGWTVDVKVRNFEFDERKDWNGGTNDAQWFSRRC